MIACKKEVNIIAETDSEYFGIETFIEDKSDDEEFLDCFNSVLIVTRKHNGSYRQVSFDVLKNTINKMKKHCKIHDFKIETDCGNSNIEEVYYIDGKFRFCRTPGYKMDSPLQKIFFALGIMLNCTTKPSSTNTDLSNLKLFDGMPVSETELYQFIYNDSVSKVELVEKYRILNTSEIYNVFRIELANGCSFNVTCDNVHYCVHNGRIIENNVIIC